MLARAQKDAAFQSSQDPVPDNKKPEFLPLGYFAIDPEYNVLAALKPITDDSKLMMPTSTGPAAGDATRRHPGVHVEGTADDPHRVR